MNDHKIINALEIRNDEYKISKTIDIKGHKASAILHSCMLIIKGLDFESTYQFKISDVKNLFKISKSDEKNIIESLKKRISIEFTQINSQKVAQVSLDLKPIESSHKLKLSDSTQEISVNNLQVLVQFRMPFLEIVYFGDDSKHPYVISHELCESLSNSNFTNWNDLILNMINIH